MWFFDALDALLTNLLNVTAKISKRFDEEHKKCSSASEESKHTLDSLDRLSIQKLNIHFRISLCEDKHWCFASFRYGEISILKIKFGQWQFQREV